MKTAIPTMESQSGTPSLFVSFADQAIHLAHTAGGQQAVTQALWLYRRPVELDALTRFRDALAQGRLARLIRPARLPFGRAHWTSAPLPSSALAVAAEPLDPMLRHGWADAQVELPLDPEHGPGWTLTVQPFTDGSTIVSLVVSHCIADGVAAALAVSEAVNGQRRPPIYPGRSQKPAVTRWTELSRAGRDAPATFRALVQLARTERGSHRTQADAATSPAPATADDRTVVFPSAFVRVPTSVWDARARSLGANRLTLLTAVTVAFAGALGRVHDEDVTLFIPVSQRDERSDTGGNRVSLATLRVPVDESRGRLHALQRRLHTTLLRARREPDPIAALLPLVPFVPKRAFPAVARLALGALANLPVTCSYMGEWPTDVLRIDGKEADRFCFRGVDRQMSVRSIEARQGVATLLAGVLDGFLHLNFIAYQPGTVTETYQLRVLVERLLAADDIAGEFFDA